ncbi:class D sortase [Paenibacillus sp. IHBB 10380]|uniref:class D sortase n=1 Tax=Paenibacillus sp. IHBB 10380 TaxID=1566358 RepID=UPI0005CFBB4F|nr:class D sortase [Paenibacillus sp. IHBB 10380]AJS60196.1 sortase [Paenibacillus sp. IHBB 10380]
MKIKIKIEVVFILLIVIGIIMLCYPKLSEMVDNYQQQKLVKEWQNSLHNIDNGEDDSFQTKYETTLSDNVAMDDETDTLQGGKEKLGSSKDQNLEGMLRIDKIDLQLPILHGATKKNMKISVASIVNTGEAGEVGNYAIAGHRNHTYGRNFNRLVEIKQGDKIEVNNGEQQLEYTVTEKLRVKPEEVWVLEGNGVDKEITLVTCDPMIDPTHRLIVKGKIIE